MIDPTGSKKAKNDFFKAIKENDSETVQKMINDGFDAKTANMWAEKPLPELAMQYGSVETAWLLMANGFMPDDWLVFSGSMWGSFAKRGMAMALSGKADSISFKAYSDIIRIAVSKTGEKLPSYIDQAYTKAEPKINKFFGMAEKFVSDLASGAGDLDGKLNKIREKAEESVNKFREAAEKRAAAYNEKAKDDFKNKKDESKFEFNFDLGGKKEEPENKNTSFSEKTKNRADKKESAKVKPVKKSVKKKPVVKAPVKTAQKKKPKFK